MYISIMTMSSIGRVVFRGGWEGRVGGVLVARRGEAALPTSERNGNAIKTARGKGQRRQN